MVNKKKIDTAVEEVAVVEAPQVAVEVSETEIMGPMPPSIQLVHAEDLWPSAMNPRKHFDEEGLEELSISIREQGILSPVVVRKLPGQDKPDPKVRQLYEVICGARRSKAAERLSPTWLVPVIVRELTDDQAFELMITENLQRQDINPMEEARAFAALYARGHKQQEIADRFGKSYVYVWQCIELSKCSPSVQDLIESGKLNKRCGLLLAKYDVADQECWVADEYHPERKYTESGLKVELQRFMEPDLMSAHFNMAVEFEPKDGVIGSCVGCQFNTGSESSAYYNKDADPACIRKSCFNKKTELYIGSILDRLPESLPLLLNYDQKPIKGLKAKIQLGWNDYSKKWLDDDELEKLGIPVRPDASEYSLPDAPDPEYYDDEDDLKEAVAEYESEKSAVLGKGSFVDALVAYEERLAAFLQSGCKISDLKKGTQLGYSLKGNEFVLFTLTKANSSINTNKETADDAVVESEINAAEINRKIARNQELAYEKAFEELTGKLSELAVYKKLDHLDEQPALTSEELVYFLQCIMPGGSQFAAPIRQLLGISEYGIAPEISYAKLVKIAANILPWAIRKYIQTNHLPGKGSYGYQKQKVGAWVSIAKSHPDLDADAIIKRHKDVYEKRNAKLQEQLQKAE